MAKNTSVLLDDHSDNFITLQIQSGRFASASEVVKAALSLFEQEVNQKKELVSELVKGEESGFFQTFDRTRFVKKLHDKHVK